MNCRWPVEGHPSRLVRRNAALAAEIEINIEKISLASTKYS